MAKWLSLLAALAATTHAALRFGCSTLTIQRLDPLVEPGRTPSSHLHQIVGGDAFNATMTGDIGEQGRCTTCTFSEDFSNYWTAVMFFRHQNGSYKRVPIMQNTALPNGINGGMTVYYTQQEFFSNGNVKMTAFKPGFRMVVGNPGAKTVQQTGLKFVCLQNKGTRFPELNEFPTRPCPGGIMTVHHFPACWDGKNVDSPDHQSHMYSTTRDAFLNAGPCPASHPVRVPQLAYETLWDTTQFNGMWPADGSNPFVLSYSDSQGYGTHADYVFGWKGDSLQRAMDHSCMFNACENGRPLKSQAVQPMNQCQVKNWVKEEIDGWLPQMPGQSASMPM
ncbi:hypothetical protein MCOR27_002832 [Pyricularia oryzae]|uniref:DUF1996 domain-containing protein n=1 Tax=Pyricularia grisea TaxID=148305 RepID=A0ABQ8N3A0_PYRGI|nr:hypothetical protein MCOR19_011619 [Pyricularia oryzae]KAI6290180.1 hypothetical protein MCOR33_011465 [Pyricularia grisea]KAI6264530.1 hypothetical protein MCOR26_011282 [Pyricularia oryzae]KAI6284276.1 hypothetical protein MCOR27_002832 [Pyricularia oryzae]KAI6316197.1 hypothetical protein MCOR29_006739 [Pyricularia oryzae]